MRFNEFKNHLFEINFNSKSTAQVVLNAPIQCGFEAETVWTEVDFVENAKSSNISWSQIKDELPRETISEVEELYTKWITKNHLEEVIDDLIGDFFEKNKPIQYEKYITDSGMEYDYEEWLGSREDSSQMKARYVNERYKADYTNWLRYHSLDLDKEFKNKVITRAKKENPLHAWASEVYGSVLEMLKEEFDIDYAGKIDGIPRVASLLKQWATKNSVYQSVEHGEYHTTRKDDDEWAVETDVTIEPDYDGQPAEIISPVYDSPQDMLNEMESLFKYFNENSVETNQSTGLHVTMSWAEEGDITVNQLKMIVLLGEQYLLKQFGREHNTKFTESQLANIKQAAAKFTKDFKNTAHLSDLENELKKVIDYDKYMSIHFKKDTNDYGRSLIEFRIAGGGNYHKAMDMVRKAVIRYSTVMVAGYTDDFHNDYVKALLRIINQMELPDIAVENNVLAPVVEFIGNSSSGKIVLSSFGECLAELKEYGNGAILQDQFLQTLVELAKLTSANKTKGTVTLRLVKALRDMLKMFEVSNDILVEYVFKYGRFDGLRERTMTMKSLDSLLKTKLFVDKAAPKFTVQYNPDYSFLLIPKRVFSNNQASEQDMKIIPLDEFYDIQKKVSAAETVSGFVNDLKRMINDLSDEEKQVLPVYEKKLAAYQKGIQEILSKYSLDIGEWADMIRVTPSNKAKIELRLNIEIQEQ